MAIEYITTPATTTFESAITTLFNELETLATGGTELTPAMLASGGTGITKGLCEIIKDYIATCSIDDNV